MKKKAVKSEDAWKKLLLYIYNNQKSWEFFTEKIKYVDEKNPIMEKLSMPRRDFQASFEFLVKNDLIKTDKETGKRKEMILTRRGLDVCLALEKHDDESRKSGALIFFTAALVFVTMIEVLVLIQAYDLNPFIITLVIVLVGAGFAGLIYKELGMNSEEVKNAKNHGERSNSFRQSRTK